MLTWHLTRSKEVQHMKQNNYLHHISRASGNKTEHCKDLSLSQRLRFNDQTVPKLQLKWRNTPANKRAYISASPASRFLRYLFSCNLLSCQLDVSVWGDVSYAPLFVQGFSDVNHYHILSYKLYGYWLSYSPLSFSPILIIESVHVFALLFTL